jgi:hypothetical protein
LPVRRLHIRLEEIDMDAGIRALPAAHLRGTEMGPIGPSTRRFHPEIRKNGCPDRRKIARSANRFTKNLQSVSWL